MSAKIREALVPFAHFATMWETMPIKWYEPDLPDSHPVYSIHAGTEWEATLTLGDFRRAEEALKTDGEKEPAP